MKKQNKKRENLFKSLFFGSDEELEGEGLITEDKKESIKKGKDSLKKQKSESNNKKALENDETAFLPDLSAYEEDFESRHILSEDKKNQINNSKNINDTFNHVEDVVEESVDIEDTSSKLYDKDELFNEDNEKFEQRKVIKTKKAAKNQNKKSNYSLNEKESENEKETNNKHFVKNLFSDSSDSDGEESSSILNKLLIPILTFLAVISILFATFSSVSNKKRVITNFESAIQSEKIADMEKLLVKSGEDSKIEDGEILAFKSLLNKDQIYRSNVVGALKEDSNKLTIDKSYKSTRPYRLENVGKQFIFFDKYRVVVDPVNILFTNFDGYKIGDKQLSANLKLLPGIYSFEGNGKKGTLSLSSLSPLYKDGTLSLDFNSVEFDNSTDVSETSSNTNKPDKPTAESTDTEGIEYIITSSDTSSIVYIDGQSSGLTIDDFNKIERKNIKADTKIKIGKEIDGKVYFSQEVLVGDNKEQNLEIVKDDQNNKPEMDQVMGLINKMLVEDEAARNSMSMDGFTTIIEPEISTTRGIINNGIESGLHYFRQYKYVKYDGDTFKVSANEDGTKTARIVGVLSYIASEYPEGGSVEDGYEPQVFEQVTGFNLTYLPEDGKWYVNSWGFAEDQINYNNLLEKVFN